MTGLCHPSREGCPSRAELEAFHAGRLADERLVAVADHLETCRDCESLVESLAPVQHAVVVAVAGVRRFDEILQNRAYQELEAWVR